MSLVYPSSDKIATPPQLLEDVVVLEKLTQEAWKCREKDRSQARLLAQHVLQFSKNPTLKAQASITQAYIFWREGRLAEALENVQTALSIVQQQNLLDWFARALNVKNCIRFELGDFTECANGLGEQLAVSRAANNLEMEACALHDLGVMHLEREAYKAEPFLQKALDLFRQENLKEGYGYALLNLAYVRETQGELAKASQLVQEVLVLANQNHLAHLKTYALAQQGRVAFKENKLELAQQFFLEALERTEQMADRPLAEVMSALVSCYRQLGKLDEARRILRASFRYCFTS